MRDWLAGGADTPGLVVVGAPISRASISASEAWSTPPAFREALARFPTWDASLSSDISTLGVRDHGDIVGDRDDPDARAAHARIESTVRSIAGATDAVVAVIGGDNSLTLPALTGMLAARPAMTWGLLTLDAHHDCRSADAGSRNGTPVRELIEAGLPGRRVAQVGIHPLGNAREHASWALAQGVHVHPLGEVRAAGIAAVVATALDELRGEGVTALYVDLDIDVVDRASAPACPASLPGGLNAADLIEAARLLGSDRLVQAVDLTEVDALADVAGTTLRLMAATFTAFAAGVARRRDDGA